MRAASNRRQTSSGVSAAAPDAVARRRRVRRFIPLVLVMLGVTLVVTGVALEGLYRVAIQVRRQALVDAVANRIALVEQVAQHSATISEVLPLLWEAQLSAPGIGATGEFMVGRSNGDLIEFLIIPRGGQFMVPQPVAVGSGLAEPMQRALAGGTGTMVGRDYRGVKVLAAYQPMPSTGWGLVAKMDLTEVRAPFRRAGAVAAATALVLGLGGALVFVRLTAPIAAEIEESEKRYRSLFERNLAGVYRATVGGEVLECNSACADILGYGGPAQMIGRPLDDFYAHPADRDALVAAISGSGQLRNYELRLRHRDGSERICLLNATAVPGTGGAPAVTEGSIVDITAIRHLESELRTLNAELEDRITARTAALAASERSYRIVADNTYDWEFWRAPDGSFRYVSPSCERVTGRRPEEFASDPGLLETIIHPEDLPGFMAHRDAEDRSRSRGELEFRIVRPDGEARWIGHECQPVSDENGRFLGIRGSNRDITESKRAEDAVNELNRSLSQTVVKLEAANKELEAFSYSVSHDLRAPLRSIDGFSRILLEDHADGLPEEGRRQLGIVRDSTVKMGRLIDDLLAFSRLGRQQLRRERVDVAALVREVRDELAAQLDGRRVEWSLGELPPAQADPKLLKLVLVNLLGNAAKFTRGRDPAAIEIGSRSDDGEVAYYVKDNGAGFDERYADKLFGVFQRLHREDEFEGTGVGLATCQRIISRHGGRIWGEGEVGRGATFRFTVPEGS